MLADGGAAADLAIVSLAIVLADGGAVADLALASYAVVLTDACPSVEISQNKTEDVAGARCMPVISFISVITSPLCL